MLISFNRPDDSSFKNMISGFRKTAKQLDSEVAQAAVAAILHYHENSFDSSRIKAVYNALDSERLKSHLTALTEVLRANTGLAGIGNSWKHKATLLKATNVEIESNLQMLLDGGLTQFGPTKKASVRSAEDKRKQQQRKVTIGDKVDDDTAAAMVNLVGAIEEMPEDKQALMLDRIRREVSGETVTTAASKGSLDALVSSVKSSAVREMLHEVIETTVDLSNRGEAIAPDGGVEQGVDKALRQLQNFMKALRRGIGDYAAGLKTAANQDAA